MWQHAVVLLGRDARGSADVPSAADMRRGNLFTNFFYRRRLKTCQDYGPVLHAYDDTLLGPWMSYIFQDIPYIPYTYVGQNPKKEGHPGSR